MYQSIPSLTIPPGRLPGIRTFQLPQGSGFRPLSCSGVCPGVCPGGVLNQSKGSIILKKSTIFALFLEQLSSSSFRMFIYVYIARSEQRDLVPIYTITNTQRIRIYPGQNFIDSRSRTKKTKLYSRFFLLRIHPDSPDHTITNTESIQICSVTG